MIEYSANGELILRGSIIDQAALHGILICIRELGFTLTLVHQEERFLIPIHRDSEIEVINVLQNNS